MILGKKVVVVMPAYNAEKTLRKTYGEIPLAVADQVILVDDCSHDHTAAVARDLGLLVFQHDKNLGYGANQKTCYRQALASGADIVVMLHPDYQYDPRLLGQMAAMIAGGECDLVLGSRFLGPGVLSSGMPLYKAAANRLLTVWQNLILGLKLAEYHTGYRAFSRDFLQRVPWEKNSNDFLFDNQILVQARYFNFRIGEVACPARYTPESSSINFYRSLKYGAGVLVVCLRYVLHRAGMIKYKILTI